MRKLIFFTDPTASGGESLGPEDVRDADRIADVTAEERTGSGFRATAAEDDASDADLFSKSGEEDLKLISGASGSVESSLGAPAESKAPTPGDGEVVARAAGTPQPHETATSGGAAPHAGMLPHDF